MKLLIVDDHQMVREALAALLAQPRYDAQILLAGDAKEGVELALQHADIDAVLLDVAMPGVDGIAALKDFSRARPDLPVLLIAGSEDPREVQRGLAAGALGYVPKSASPDTLMSALRLVLSGEVYVPPLLLSPTDGSQIAVRSSLLTNRQSDVLKLLARGLSNKEIGRELSLSERTVKAHATAIFKSFGVTNRADAVAHARKHDLI
jgi:two-component system, NarL family, nitrate/nitrite response regulator NarL